MLPRLEKLGEVRVKAMSSPFGAGSALVRGVSALATPTTNASTAPPSVVQTAGLILVRMRLLHAFLRAVHSRSWSRERDLHRRPCIRRRVTRNLEREVLSRHRARPRYQA